MRAAYWMPFCVKSTTARASEPGQLSRAGPAGAGGPKAEAATPAAASRAPERAGLVLVQHLARELPEVLALLARGERRRGIGVEARLGQLGLRRLAPLARAVGGRGARHGVEPGREAPLVAVGREPAPGAHETLLRQVLGLVARAHALKQEVVEALLVALDQQAEGLPAPCLRAGGESLGVDRERRGHGPTWAAPSACGR